MDRHLAYSEIARELERYRALGYDSLRQLVDSAPRETIIQANGEEFTLEVCVTALTKPPGALRVEASAFSPNWFKFERIDESIVILPSAPGIVLDAII